jgi:hypothetical protein
VKAAKSVASKSKDKKVSAKKESKKTRAPESTEVPVTTEIAVVPVVAESTEGDAHGGRREHCSYQPASG